MAVGDRKSLYIETTIPSYYTARDSRDVLKLHRQIVTRAFWRDERHRFRLCTSQETLTECSRGDPDAAAKRIEFLEGIERFLITEDAKAFAEEYRQLLDIPDRAGSDCVHLAVCVIHRLDYLLTWNCTHLNAIAQMKAQEYNEKRGLWTPALVTPEIMRQIITKEKL